MVDLCEGPHVPNTGALKAQDVLNMSRAYWRADQARESLYRVYGITFPDSKQLKVRLACRAGRDAQNAWGCAQEWHVVYQLNVAHLQESGPFF